MQIAINGYFWDRPRTGSGQYLRHLWRGLSDIAASAPANEPHRLSLLMPGGRTMEIAPGFPYKRRGDEDEQADELSSLRKLAWEGWEVMRAARSGHAQLLHVPYFTAPFLKRLPVVVTAHDMIPWVIPGHVSSLPVRLYLRLAAASVRRARLILADSEASRRDVIRILKVRPSRVHTVYLGTEPHPDFTSQAIDEVRGRLGLPERYAFYIGGFIVHKNVPLLLRAWRAACDGLVAQGVENEPPLLAIAGALPDPGGVFPDVRSEAARLGLGDGESGAVRFLGRISEADKPLLMAGARLFVYPSAYEGFGLDPLEAMSVGCPVVSSSGGSLKEVVGEGGLLVPPGNEGAMSAGIARVWVDDALRAELSHKGKAWSRRFTWERTAAQTWDLYKRALTREKGAA